MAVSSRALMPSSPGGTGFVDGADGTLVFRRLLAPPGTVILIRQR